MALASRVRGHCETGLPEKRGICWFPLGPRQAGGGQGTFLPELFSGGSAGRGTRVTGAEAAMERRAQAAVPVEWLAGVTREQFLRDVYPRVGLRSRRGARSRPAAARGRVGLSGRGGPGAAARPGLAAAERAEAVREDEGRREISRDTCSAGRASADRPPALVSPERRREGLGAGSSYKQTPSELLSSSDS